MRAKIDELPTSYRTVILLRDIEELDSRTVAESLGCSTMALKVRLHRARQALRTLIGRALADWGRADAIEQAEALCAPLPCAPRRSRTDQRVRR